jgi:hypothetical protein
MSKIHVPIKYVPMTLKSRDRKKQINMLKKSRRLYKQHKFYTRKALPSYHNKTSNHIVNARKLYKVDNVLPSRKLSIATGCSVSALKKIVNKGEGAYFSSGSRPNQTGQSWGIARLASAITGGKSAAVDYDILDSGCKHSGKAFRLARQSRKKYGFGHGHRTRVFV